MFCLWQVMAANNLYRLDFIVYLKQLAYIALAIAVFEQKSNCYNVKM